MSDRRTSFKSCGSAVDSGAAPATPLRGRTVLLVHPAWHSCGSHKVFITQAQAYRGLGADVIDLAVADFPGSVAGSFAHSAYLAATPGLEAEKRYFAGMPFGAVFAPTFLRVIKDWMHGNYAAMLAEIAKQASLPAELMRLKIDLIHCNHFFCMPAAAKLRGSRSCPILLDTHDLQARQYMLRQRGSWKLPPAATYESMLAVELANVAGADVLIHLNKEEAATFEQFLPHKRHVLVFPAVEPVSVGCGGSDIIIVASANYPNLLGISWFLTEVLPQVPGAPVKIIGNIDQVFRRRAPALYRKHASAFVGSADDLNGVYARAAGVLLPTTEGFGISIKTIEALSSGAPLIATKRAFRGMAIDPTHLSNVTLAGSAVEFAAAIRRLMQGNSAGDRRAGDRMKSDTRALYDRLFSGAAYRHALAALTQSVLPAVRIGGEAR